jgi:hypothetical protein
MFWSHAGAPLADNKPSSSNYLSQTDATAVKNYSHESYFLYNYRSIVKSLMPGYCGYRLILSLTYEDVSMLVVSICAWRRRQRRQRSQSQVQKNNLSLTTENLTQFISFQASICFKTCAEICRKEIFNIHDKSHLTIYRNSFKFNATTEYKELWDAITLVMNGRQKILVLAKLRLPNIKTFK